MVELTSFELELEALGIEVMGFILNCQNYLYVSPMMEFHKFITRFCVILRQRIRIPYKRNLVLGGKEVRKGGGEDKKTRRRRGRMQHKQRRRRLGQQQAFEDSKYQSTPPLLFLCFFFYFFYYLFIYAFFNEILKGFLQQE